MGSMIDFHKCPKCYETKYRDNFQLYKGNPNGWCRKCRTNKESERRRSKGIQIKEFSEITYNNKHVCIKTQVETIYLYMYTFTKMSNELNKNFYIIGLTDFIYEEQDKRIEFKKLRDSVAIFYNIGYLVSNYNKFLKLKKDRLQAIKSIFKTKGPKIILISSKID
jgi:hypothetical protein